MCVIHGVCPPGLSNQSRSFAHSSSAPRPSYTKRSMLIECERLKMWDRARILELVVLGVQYAVVVETPLESMKVRRWCRSILLKSLLVGSFLHSLIRVLFLCQWRESEALFERKGVTLPAKLEIKGGEKSERFVKARLCNSIHPTALVLFRNIFRMKPPMALCDFHSCQDSSSQY
jgi:hypothetical protein